MNITNAVYGVLGSVVDYAQQSDAENPSLKHIITGIFVGAVALTGIQKGFNYLCSRPPVQEQVSQEAERPLKIVEEDAEEKHSGSQGKDLTGIDRYKLPMVNDKGDEKQLMVMPRTMATPFLEQPIFNPFSSPLVETGLSSEIMHSIEVARFRVSGTLPEMEPVRNDEQLGASFCILQAALNSQGILDSLVPALRLRLNASHLFGENAKSGKFEFINTKIDDLGKIDTLVENLKKSIRRHDVNFKTKHRQRMAKTLVLLHFLRIVVLFSRQMPKTSGVNVEERPKISYRDVEQFHGFFQLMLFEKSRAEPKEGVQPDTTSVHSRMNIFLSCFSSLNDETSLSGNFPELYTKKDGDGFQEAFEENSDLTAVAKIYTKLGVHVVLLSKVEGTFVRHPREPGYTRDDHFHDKHQKENRIVLVEPRASVIENVEKGWKRWIDYAYARGTTKKP